MICGKDLTVLEIMRRYSTEESAREYFERVRWPNGPVCPHCGGKDKNYALTPNRQARIREGLYKCGTCDGRFSVTVGTVMESSKVPLQKWLLGFYLMCASEAQISALQLQRQLEIGSYKTALLLSHRIRFALKDIFSDTPVGGEIEADETYIGGNAMGKGRGYKGSKVAMVSLVERDGRVRSMIAKRVNSKTIDTLLRKHVAEDAHLIDGGSPLNIRPGQRIASHAHVDHRKEEYAYYDWRAGRTVTTNTVEGYFGNSKCSLDGAHLNGSPQHLQLYAAELDFKYNTRKETDGERTRIAIGIGRFEGKCLMYRSEVSG